MDKRDDVFLKRIGETYRIEAEEHLNALMKDLTDLEKNQDPERYPGLIEAMFREVHSLKGASRSVGHKEVEFVCQPLESLFAALKHGDFILSASQFDIIYRTLESMSFLIKGYGSILSSIERQKVRELISELRNSIERPADKPDRQNNAHAATKIVSATVSGLIPEEAKDHETIRNQVFNSIDTVRIKVSKLDPLLMQAEEMIQAKKASRQRLIDIVEVKKTVAECRTESMKLKSLQNSQSGEILSEWVDDNDSRLGRLDSVLSDLTNALQRDEYNLNMMVDNHLESMRQVLMLPVSSVTETFPGMVREMSDMLHKEIDFDMTGTELEVDKRIIEELKDPLLHLIRNCIDHGIENSQDRLVKKKNSTGKINLDFSAREGGVFEVTVKDDGAGIDSEKVLKTALRAGIISTADAKNAEPDKVLQMIFLSGVSTSSFITDISGRGLGLSIVQEKVEKLNGRIVVETELNRGTSFHLFLPITHSTFRGLLVRVCEDLFILPLINIVRVLELRSEEVKSIENRETILIDDKVVMLADLGHVLGLPENIHTCKGNSDGNQDSSDMPGVVILSSGKNLIGFKVSEIIEEQQVVVKNTGKLLLRVRNISGATILGSGRVVPVLNVSDLLKSAIASTGKSKFSESREKLPAKIKKVLVADDSITSRTLLKNILETAGYQVTTAVDGIDALTKVLSSGFDLVVSDVDMPMMNGFELITKIRNHKKLSELPVILVTALGSDEDHERGMSAGADAYIIKSRFDQTNLLEIVRKLIQ